MLDGASATGRANGIRCGRTAAVAAARMVRPTHFTAVRFGTLRIEPVFAAAIVFAVMAYGTS